MTSTDLIADELMDSPGTIKELAAVLEVPHSTVANALWEMRQAGLVESVGERPREGNARRGQVLYAMVRTKRAAAA